MEGQEVRQNLGPHGSLLHLLVEVDALGAEYSAVGGRRGLETGIESREGPEGRQVLTASLGADLWPQVESRGQGALHAHPLTFQLGEDVRTQVQGCCSVFDNPGTALVPLGAALLAPS